MRLRKSAEPTKRMPQLQNKSGTNRTVFSYHSNRSTSETARPRNDVFDQETKKVNRSLAYVPSIVATIIIVCSIAYTLILDVSKPKILPLAESGNSLLRSPEYYEEQIARLMEESFSSRTKLTIDTRQLESDILASMPEIDNVSVNIPLLGKRPIVQISSTTPSLVITTNNSYVVGVNGKVLMELSDLPEDQKNDLIIVNDTVAVDAKVGDVIIPISTIEFIKSLQYQFKARGMQIESIELPAIANELHVRVKDAPYNIRFNLQEDAREQAGRYFALTDRIKAGGLPQPKEYIDVRVDGRAYYK